MRGEGKCDVELLDQIKYRWNTSNAYKRTLHDANHDIWQLIGAMERQLEWMDQAVSVLKQSNRVFDETLDYLEEK